MLDDLLEKRIIQLPEPKSIEDVGRTDDPKQYRYHRMVSHPLEKSVTLKERIMQLIEDGMIILDLDNIVETNHISCQTRGLSLIQFGSLKSFVLHEHRLPNPATQERSFPVNVFDRLAVNMTSCFEVEEESDKREENSFGEIDKTLVALKAIPMYLKWGKIFSLPNKTC